MKLKEALLFMFHLFCVITTCEILFIAGMALLFHSTLQFGPLYLLEIPLVALCGVLPVLLFVGSEKASRLSLNLRKALHFVLTAGVVFGLLLYLGWMDTQNAVAVLVLFLLIYAGAWIVQETRERTLAKQLNERLNEFHEDENETD